MKLMAGVVGGYLLWIITYYAATKIVTTVVDGAWCASHIISHIIKG